MRFSINNRSENVVENEKYDEAIDFEGTESGRGQTDYVHGLIKRKDNELHVMLFSQNNKPCQDPANIKRSIQNQFESFLNSQFNNPQIKYNLS